MKIENLKTPKIYFIYVLTSLNPLSMYVDGQKYALKQILCSFVIGILAKKKGKENLSVCLSLRKKVFSMPLAKITHL